MTIARRIFFPILPPTRNLGPAMLQGLPTSVAARKGRDSSRLGTALAPAESSLELTKQSNTRHASGSGHGGAADGGASMPLDLPLD
jgi:hypothetical protein